MASYFIRCGTVLAHFPGDVDFNQYVLDLTLPGSGYLNGIHQVQVVNAVDEGCLAHCPAHFIGLQTADK